MQVENAEDKRIAKAVTLGGKRQQLLIKRLIFRLEPDAAWPPAQDLICSHGSKDGEAASTSNGPAGKGSKGKKGKKGAKKAGAPAAADPLADRALDADGGPVGAHDRGFLRMHAAFLVQMPLLCH